MEEIREIQLRVLDAFDAHCTRHDLHYTVAYGTLLGAVRHRGYIPWDDDIDVMMPREDFERLCSQATVGPFAVRSLVSDRTWPLAYAKICDRSSRVVEDSRHDLRLGVNIDVFPLDRVPESGWQRRAWFLVCRAFEAVQALQSITPRPGRSRWRASLLRLGQPLVGLVPGATLAAARTKHATSWRGRSHAAGVVVGSFPWHTPTGWLSDTRRGPFESLDVRLPADADGLLTRLYGRYLDLPPLEERRSHHAQDAFRR